MTDLRRTLEKVLNAGFRGHAYCAGAPAKPSSNLTPAVNVPAFTRASILIAEDVNVIALILTRALEKAGYRVDVARDGEECLRKAQATVPDLVLLDIMMPKMNGIEVLKALRADPRTRDLAVVMCSAKDFKTERDAAAQLGALDYFIKPSTPEFLVERVGSILARTCREAANSDSNARDAAVEAYQPVLDTTRPRFTLWGTRGSTPATGGRFLRHGGNTSCMSLTCGDELLIFDAGSGIRDLGLELMAGKTRKLHLFITHTHWDHIQGFPFFMPAFVPDFEIFVYGSVGFGKSLEAIFRGQLDRDYFPVQMEDMRSILHFHNLPDTPIEVGGMKITWEFAHHPLPTVGYKIEAAGRTLAWMPDNEFLQGYIGPPHALTCQDSIVAPFEKIIAFLSGVDVLIHEAQYTPDEYPKKVGWGHCSVPNACLLMKLAGIRRWIVTHHDPNHDDDFLEKKLGLARQILEEIGHPVPVSHGYDGMAECL
jgi:CheY-like chemotaxis protein/phosphoribosyl 1,2-cyclic phosphodiesterase